MKTDVTPHLLLGIIGTPLGHSLSPLLHNEMLRLRGIAGTYLPWELDAEALDVFAQAVRVLPVHGCSVTIPHKVAVMRYCDRLSDRARAVGAVNTLYWEGRELIGENTDVAGLMAPLADMDLADASVLVLGAGGVARAAAAGLAEHGVKRVGITCRTGEKSRAFALEFRIEDVPWTDRFEWGSDVVVNATPLGMTGRNATLSPWSEEAFTPSMIAYDLVYTPEQTIFLRQAAAAGCRTIGGLDMFVHQAAAQFRLWTGNEMDTGFATLLCREALAARQG